MEIWQLESYDFDDLKEYFGITKDFREAGYLLPDGSLLDFSGKHCGFLDKGCRTVDHRDIAEFWGDNTDGKEAMINFIANGAIRLCPEIGGINLATVPTEQQKKVLKRMIDFFRAAVIIDFDVPGKDTIYSLIYNGEKSTKQILEEMENYFLHNTSYLMRFHEMNQEEYELDA